MYELNFEQLIQFIIGNFRVPKSVEVACEIQVREPSNIYCSDRVFNLIVNSAVTRDSLSTMLPKFSFQSFLRSN